MNNSTALTPAVRVATFLWIAVSAINAAVWLTVSIVSGSVDRPWFLWATVAGAVVVGALRVAERRTIDN